MHFNYVQRGQRLEIPTAEFHNAIIAALNKEFNTKRGIFDNTIDATKEFKSPRHPIYIYANNDIPAYSIFTITTTSASGTLDPRIPKAGSLQITTETDPVYVVNDGKGLGSGGDYLLDILGDEHPHLVHYNSINGVPTIGDEVGVLSGTYTVVLEQTGLIAVSLPDEINELIWVVKKASGGTSVADEYLAEGFLVYELCGTADDEQIEVERAKSIPSCNVLDLDGVLILNTCRHQAQAGDKVRLVKTCMCVGTGSGDSGTGSVTASDLDFGGCTGTGTGTGAREFVAVWDIYDVQRHITCLVNEVQSRDYCMVQLIVKAAVERCRNLEDTCTIIEFIKDCTDTGQCDAATQEGEYDLDDCCFEYVLGTGSWGTGTGTQ